MKTSKSTGIIKSIRDFRASFSGTGIDLPVGIVLNKKSWARLCKEYNESLPERYRKEPEELESMTELQAPRLLALEARDSAYKARIERLEGALQIFADPASWRLGGSCDPNSGAFRGQEIATTALSSTGNGEVGKP